MAHRLRIEPTGHFAGHRVWLDDFELGGVREVQLEITANGPTLGRIDFIFNGAEVDIEDVSLIKKGGSAE